MPTIDRERLERLSTQIKYRVEEGGGEALFVLGIDDVGRIIGMNKEELDNSIKILEKAANAVGIASKVIRVEEYGGKFIAQILLRYKREENLPILLKIPLLGNVDSGKSTILGVLVTGELDDGRGKAMKMIARYLHEVVSGRTSSINYRVLGFDEVGEVVNYKLSSPLDEANIYLKSSKVITFVDLAGHEKYLRTTLKGVLGHEDDYIMFVIGANAGPIGMAREHLGIAVALKIPLFVVITKVDMVHPTILKRVVSEIKRLLKLPGVDKIPMIIKDINDVVVASSNMQSGRLVPIFLVSSVTGVGIDLLRMFLNLLPPRLRWDDKAKGLFKLYIDDKFNVSGVGTIVSGLIHSGRISPGDQVFLGPFSDGSFRKVRIKSIEINRVPVWNAKAGQDVALALAGVKYDEIIKGMVLLDKNAKPKAIWRFDAEVTILRHPTTIKSGYQAVLHIHTIRQAAIFENTGGKYLRTGDTARVRLKFMYRPEYIEPGDRFVFREGRTRGLGRIIKIYD